MKIKLKSNDAFTLVETIVVGLLISILAMGVFTIFIMYRNESSTTSANMRLQIQGEALTDEIARKARESWTILAEGEAYSDYPSGEDNFEADTVHFYFRGGERNVSFAINTNGIVIFNDGTGWKNFSIDGNPIEVKNDGEAKSKFILGSNRAMISVDLILRTSVGTHEFSVTLQRGAFLCRG